MALLLTNPKPKPTAAQELVNPLLYEFQDLAP